ncbi:hypothetical protein [Desulfovibrio inopinatus]|uniref:hypothetical protein n=1 Tax=Desulfovibrio inopinatus TaxID=102109 RepID=UPI0003F95C83|nr:hypothetical protein [Desulfovibrio inopinatus]
MENKNVLTRWMALLGGIVLIWAVLFVGGGALRDAVPEIKTLANFVDASGIETGNFYYTDVEIVGHADINARSTFEYTPHGPHPDQGSSSAS